MVILCSERNGKNMIFSSGYLTYKISTIHILKKSEILESYSFSTNKISTDFNEFNKVFTILLVMLKITLKVFESGTIKDIQS